MKSGRQESRGDIRVFICIRIGFLLAIMLAILPGCGGAPCDDASAGLREFRVNVASARQAWDVQFTEDGGFIAAGYTSPDFLSPPEDAVVIKLDASGAVQWTHTLGGEEVEEARAVQPAGDGGYIVVGNTGGTVFPPGALMQLANDVLLYKIDAMGAEVWSRTLSVNKFTIAYGACVNDDGSIVVAGSAGEREAGDRGALLVKFDAEGAELWRRFLTGGSGLSATDIVATRDGGYAIVGYSKRNGEPRQWDVYAAKLDAEGLKEWEFLGADRLTYPGDRFGEGIVQTQDGGYAIVANAFDFRSGELFVAKLDPDGNLTWAANAPGSPHSEGYGLVEMGDGSLVAAGSSYGAGSFLGFATCVKTFAVRFDVDGAIRWSSRFGGSGTGGANALARGADDTLVLAGYSIAQGNEAVYLVITDAGLK